jgi:hypothetical protein
MPTIVDPDGLIDSAVNSPGASGNNIYIDPAVRTIRINNGSSSLDETGVTGQALYSKLKELWKDDPQSKNLIAYPFPMVAITPEQFEFRFGWAPADDSSRGLIRTAGWREYGADNSTLKREYLGVISLGSIDGSQGGAGGDQDFPYYAFDTQSSATDFQFAGPVNEAIQTLDSSAFDYRTDVLSLYIRQPAKTYDQQNTVGIGIPQGNTIPYNVQRFPLAEGTDLNVTVNDATISTNEGAGQKYDSADGGGPRILYEEVSEASNTFGYTKDLNGGPFQYGIKIYAANGTGGDNLTKNEIYSWVQYKLRQDTNIEDSAGAAKIGRLQDRLLEFVGPTLKTLNATNPDGGGTGVAVIDFNNTDINDLVFRDSDTVEQTFPFSAVGTLTFSDEIVADSAAAAYSVFYTYTRATDLTTLDISGVGAATGAAHLDSAEFTTTAEFPSGLANSDYFILNGADNVGNDQIWEITTYRTTSSLAARTYDDALNAVNETSGGTVSFREHPINSPQALLVDSGGTAIEDTGGITGTLTGLTPASNTISFTYDYDVNTQGDRSIVVSPAITIRALGLENGSFVEATGTIGRNTANSYSIVSPIERNYDNP